MAGCNNIFQSLFSKGKKFTAWTGVRKGNAGWHRFILENVCSCSRKSAWKSNCCIFIISEHLNLLYCFELIAGAIKIFCPSLQHKDWLNQHRGQSEFIITRAFYCVSLQTYLHRHAGPHTENTKSINYSWSSSIKTLNLSSVHHEC